MSSLNATPRANRFHIIFLGCRNAGKSSLMNAIAGQEVSLISPVPGTTTDPVYKAIELPSLGAVELIDAPGWDDIGELGKMRVEAARKVLRRADAAVLVVDATIGMSRFDCELLKMLNAGAIPFVPVLNKCDQGSYGEGVCANPEGAIRISAKSGEGLSELIAALSRLAVSENRSLLPDGILAGALAVLVTPIDSSAPQGRIILPQQQVLRELLDASAASLVVQPDGLKSALDSLNRAPDIVIVDSQCFAQVEKILPKSMPLTSFSILFAAFKGDLSMLVRGAKAIWNLKDGDRVLIAEACTHVRKEEDIGTVKIPALLKAKTGKRLELTFCRGMDFPEDLDVFSLVIHCGGCMINRREMMHRLNLLSHTGVAVTNYGICLAELNGILDRCLKCFPANAR